MQVVIPLLKVTQESFSLGKPLASIRAIALSDKMYMLKTMSPIKSG
nr:hypothetical protein [Dendronalium sp. ChiSLP03b]